MAISQTIETLVMPRTTNQLGDEYQELMYHKSSTVTAALVPLFSVLAGAILAWSLDGSQSLLALVAFLPAVVPGLIGSLWLKNYVPRPALTWRDTHPVMLAVYAVLTVVMLVGIAVRMGSSSFLTGAVAGAVAAVFLVPVIAKRTRRRDEERLNAQFSD